MIRDVHSSIRCSELLPVLAVGVALTQLHDLVFGFVEPHEVHLVPLVVILSFGLVHYTTQLGGIGKLARAAFDPIINVIDEDIKEYWSQHRPLGDTTHR